MGMYKHLRELWKKPHEIPGYQDMIIAMRREPATVRLEKPTRLDRARSIGYKAKQGVLVVRQRVGTGGHRGPKPAGGRRSKRFSTRIALSKNHQQIAEERVDRKYPNCEVVGSYVLVSDSKFTWYEVILVDRESASAKANPQLAQIAKQRGRAQRGKTSTARKSRGLRGKGKGYEKSRPSKPANKGRTN